MGKKKHSFKEAWEQESELEGRPNTSSSGTRQFSGYTKEKCWDKAEVVNGRDPYRWRRDHLGNLVFRKLIGCYGCLCFGYDHIFPHSKGGKGSLANCQILQTAANTFKGNRTDVSKSDLIRASAFCRVKERDMDLLEHMAYGYVRRGPDSGPVSGPVSGGCRIQ